MTKIAEFEGNWRFLSNFWPCAVLYDGWIYPSAEHAYQAAKTLDPQIRENIRNCATPALAKKLGRSIARDKMRPEWDKLKVAVMRTILMNKFTRNEALGKALLATGCARLEEGNWWNDRFWGVSPANSGQGENQLGLALMDLRNAMRSEPCQE